MAIKQVREAFTRAGNGVLICTAARLLYAQESGVEHQYLEFDGHFVANSKPFAVRSDRIGKQGDLAAAAAATAAKLLKQEEQPAAPPPPAEGPAP
jgi:hypothetical protein